MKKLYTTILIIAVTLFISCNEQKAEDDIKKAFTKITDKAVDVVDAVDKVTPKPTNEGAKAQGSNTPTNTEGEADSNPQGSGAPTNTESKDAGGDTPPAPTLTKPVLSSELAPWNTPITFPKVAEHTYTLKEAKTGVTLSETTGNRMQVTATQSAQNVIIVATFDGTTSESNPIEFTRIPGNTLSFPHEALAGRDTTTSHTAIKSGGVAGDTRNIKYTVSPTGEGVTIDSSSGRVEITSSATERDYTITAELQQNAKYERSTATSKLEVSNEIEPPSPAPTLTKPVLSSELAPWGTVITFPKVAKHTYTLKEAKTGVTLSETTGNRMQVAATQPAQNVIIVATFDGTTSESNPIEFTRKQGNTLSFTGGNWVLDRGSTFTQTATKSGRVAGDTRNIKYSVSPTGQGVTIDSSSGEVTIGNNADTIHYTIIAELQLNKKYERATDTYDILVTILESGDDDDR